MQLGVGRKLWSKNVLAVLPTPEAGTFRILSGLAHLGANEGAAICIDRDERWQWQVLTNRSARVACTSVISCAVALSTWTAIGRPWRSAMAMIFDPSPRFVLPTQAPPRLAGAKLPSMNASLCVKVALVVKRLGKDTEDAFNTPVRTHC